MHVYDIEEALDQADAHRLRHAFQVLVAYPHLGHIEGARSAAKLDGLFEHVTSALQLDQAVLPDAVCRTIERVTSVPIDPRTSYAHAAIVACEFRDRWRALYRDELPGDAPSRSGDQLFA